MAPLLGSISLRAAGRADIGWCTAVGGVLVTGVQVTDEGLRVMSPEREWLAANVLLALGRAGAPQQLGVPGEDAPHVAYRLKEPEALKGQHVVVVGGGNSAVESALILAQDGQCASVSISYRKPRFLRARGDNRKAIEQAVALLFGEPPGFEVGNETLDERLAALWAANDPAIFRRVRLYRERHTDEDKERCVAGRPGLDQSPGRESLDQCRWISPMGRWPRTGARGPRRDHAALFERSHRRRHIRPGRLQAFGQTTRRKGVFLLDQL